MGWWGGGGAGISALSPKHNNNRMSQIGRNSGKVRVELWQRVMRDVSPLFCVIVNVVCDLLIYTFPGRYFSKEQH